MRKRILVPLLALTTPVVVHAQVTISDLGTTFGLGTSDLERTVINIVQWILGLLALVAVVIIIYAGFIFITGGGGSEEKVEQAKKMITAAVIGLVVVLLAWAIVIFVVGTTTNVTQ